jgi:uncharacterized protein (DUF169 family)
VRKYEITRIGNGKLKMMCYKQPRSAYNQESLLPRVKENLVAFLTAQLFKVEEEQDVPGKIIPA